MFETASYDCLKGESHFLFESFYVGILCPFFSFDGVTNDHMRSRPYPPPPTHTHMILQREREGEGEREREKKKKKKRRRRGGKKERKKIGVLRGHDPKRIKPFTTDKSRVKTKRRKEKPEIRSKSIQLKNTLNREEQ